MKPALLVLTAIVFTTPTVAQVLTPQQEQYRLGWEKMFRDDPSAWTRIKSCVEAQGMSKQAVQACANAESAYQNAKSAAAVNARRQQELVEQQQRQERERQEMMLGDLEGRVNKLERAR